MNPRACCARNRRRSSPRVVHRAAQAAVIGIEYCGGFRHDCGATSTKPRFSNIVLCENLSRFNVRSRLSVGTRRGLNLRFRSIQFHAPAFVDLTTPDLGPIFSAPIGKGALAIIKVALLRRIEGHHHGLILFPIELKLPSIAALFARALVTQSFDVARELERDEHGRGLESDGVPVAAFYSRFGFEPTPSGPLTLFILTETIRQFAA